MDPNARIGAYGGAHRRDLNRDPYEGIDKFERLQQPDFKPVDELSRFVHGRIVELELMPRGEVMALYDQPGGTMAHRYASHLRKDCVTWRELVARYVTCPDPAERAGLVAAVRIVAARFSDHREYRPDLATG